MRQTGHVPVYGSEQAVCFIILYVSIHVLGLLGTVDATNRTPRLRRGQSPLTRARFPCDVGRVAYLHHGR